MRTHQYTHETTQIHVLNNAHINKGEWNNFFFFFLVVKCINV
jgi:hypothetical protein